MAIKKVTIKKNQKLSHEQEAMLQTALLTLAEPDEEMPLQTEKQLEEFRKLSEIRKAERRKQNVTIRLSQNALNKAKSLGKGYTSVLSRILENALNDPELIKKSL